MVKLTTEQIKALAAKYGLTYAQLRAVIGVESGGIGFSATTGKIIIQFEPSWFKRNKADWKKDTKNVTWQTNGVENQTEEWRAFNSAFASDANAAMKSTSVGLMQVMGFHWKLLGFKDVGAMWDFTKESEANQLELGLKFISSNPKMLKALKTNDWATFSYYYNGEQYRKFNYDTRLKAAYEKALKEK